MKEVS